MGLLNHGKEFKMAHEWQVGDRFSVEGVITETADSDGDYKAIFDGHTTDGSVFGAEMACAKLIQAAAPEPQKPDLSKPLKVRRSGETVTYLCTSSNGEIAVEDCRGGIMVYRDGALENIPEPKIKGRREAVLLSNGEVAWKLQAMFCKREDILGRTWVEITEGDGMEES